MSKTLKYNDYFLTYDEYLLGYENINGTIENEHDYSKDYLTLEALEDGTFTFTIGSYVTTSKFISVSYSTDEGKHWNTLFNNGEHGIGEYLSITTPTIHKGDKVLWKGESVGTHAGFQIERLQSKSNFSSTGNFKAYGNICSLLNEEFNEEVLTTSFSGLFYDCKKLISAKNLVLPRKLTDYAFYNFFYGCSNLIDFPELPETNLTNYCYSYMFAYCSSLNSTPELPATTLASHCYDSMFSNCSSLTNVAKLPATTLAEQCYYKMFKDCSLLTLAPVLPATTLIRGCYGCMFQKCTSLITAPELPALLLENGGGNLGSDGCYNWMFDGCTNLNYIKALFTNTPGNTLTYQWVRNVSPTGTFVKNSAASWNVTGDNAIPSGWTVIETNE